MAEPKTYGRKHEDIDVIRPFFKIIPNIYLILEQKPSCVIDVWIIKAQLLILNRYWTNNVPTYINTF